MNDPIAFFLTFTTYGTWLPGDSRGWVEYQHGWQLPDPVLQLEAQARMTEDACILNPQQRAIVQQQIAETCQHRGWILHAVNCRSNHAHAVISAPDTKPKKIRADIKAWCTRRLKERSDGAATTGGPSAAASAGSSMRKAWKPSFCMSPMPKTGNTWTSNPNA